MRARRQLTCDSGFHRYPLAAPPLLCRRAAEKVSEARPEQAQEPEQNLPVLRFRFERIIASEILVDDRDSAVRLSRGRMDRAQ